MKYTGGARVTFTSGASPARPEQQALVAEVVDPVLEDTIGLEGRELHVEVRVPLHQQVGVPL
jgi:hypothetical protein